MKKAIIGLGFVLALNGGVAAQKHTPSEPGERGEEKRSKQSQKSTDGKRSKNAGNLASTASLQGQLQSTLDVRNVSVGDEVRLKAVHSVKQNGEVVVQKGSNLIGRVTAVTRRGKDGAASTLGLVFDRIEGKDLSMPITASINSITNVAASASSSSDMFDSDISSSTRSRGSVQRSGSGGGLLGGVGNTVGGVVNTATNTVGGVANTATGAVGSTTSTGFRTLNGITVSNSASASGSSTLSAAGKDLRLEKGVIFNMNVGPQQ